MDSLLQDLRFALRLLWKDKGFTLAAVLTLAVCLGANAALFTVVDTVLLKPLPVPHAGELVTVLDSFPNAGIPRAGASVPDYFDRVKGVPAFSQGALYGHRNVSINAGDRPEQVTVMQVTPSFFPLLQVSPLLGRTFRDAEGEEGQAHKVILSYATWQDQFGGLSDAIGRDLRINDEPYTIVGVMPRGFTFIDPDVRAWVPSAFTANDRSDDVRYDQNWDYVGRLKPGATLEQARAQLAAIDRANFDRLPQYQQLLKDAGFHVEAFPLQADLVRNVRSMLYLLWGGALFVLLIGAVNVANLALVRARVRLRELATRAALGAGRFRLARQLVTEALVVSGIGGGLGLLLGYGALQGFRLLNLDQLPRGAEIQMNGVVVAFVIALAALVGLLVALLPAFSILRADLSAVFHEDARTGSAGRGARVMRRTLVVAQVALAFVLLFGAGLLLASFRQVLSVDPGFDAQRVLTASVRLPDSRYPNGRSVAQFVERALASVRALPGVAAAGATNSVPLGGSFTTSVILAQGRQMRRGESFVSPYRVSVTPGYFEAMRIGLVKGRFFDDRDGPDAPKVVIVDDQLAQHFWPDQDPIGRRLFRPENPSALSAPPPEKDMFTVVGVVRHIAMRSIAEGDRTVGAYYFPLAQSAPSRVTFAIRTAGDPNGLIADLRQQIAAIDPELPVYDTEAMRQRVDNALVTRRSPLVLSLGFGIVALFLAAVGIYGVLAYLVTQRRREIGIRMALGSSRRAVFELILGEGVVVLAIGFAVGLAGAFIVGRGLSSQLYQVAPANPLVLAGATVLLALVALVACLVPAGRATRIDPSVALRQE
jgi:predicted permease